MGTVNRAIVRAMWLAMLVLAVAVGLQGQPGGGTGKYLIMLSDEGPAGAFTMAQLARSYGGTLRPGEDQGGAYCVELGAGAAEALRHDARVASVRAWVGRAEPRTESPAKVAVESGSSWQSGEYEYDGSGSIYRIGNTTLGSDSYTYDVLGRLVRGTAGRGAGEQRYTYDGFANIKTITTTGHPTRVLNVDPATNQLNGAVPGGNTLAAYDEAGNQIGENGANSRTFDAFHNMARNVDGTTYVYDANDERIAVVNASRTQWRWTVRDLSGRVLREYEETISGGVSSWAWRKDYVYRGDALLGAYVSEDGVEKRIHYHLDHLGTPRLITEATAGGAVRRQEAADYPFGEEWAFQVGSTERRHFTGHERDYNSGTAFENADYLDYMHARYYSPGMGRFLSVDPSMDMKGNLATPQRWNRYAYVQNNPINATDPDGKDTYWINRQIGGHRASHNPWDPVTHSFIATTNGSVLQTYSWGNTPDQFTENRWNENNPEDLVAAWEALRENGYLGSVEPKGAEGTLDPYIKQAFEILKKDPASNHPNGGVVNNCKTEAQRLVNLARELQKTDEAKRDEERKKPKVKPEKGHKEKEDRP